MELERGLLRFKLFLSTPSARRATSASAGRKCPGSDFYPRPPRGGRHFLWRPRCKAVPISIHALREEGDSCLCRLVWRLEISIHALREEGDGTFAGLLTCPRYFYPRPPRGGRRGNFRRWPTDLQISIHALREEGDNVSELPAGAIEVFLSTPSARRATAQYAASHGQRGISIHALREEGDASASSTSTAPQRFLSTPSARRATEETNTVVWMNGFLSTPSARRATSAGRSWCPPHSYFYPRPPRGGRP